MGWFWLWEKKLSPGPLVGMIELPLLATVALDAFPPGVTLKRDATALVTAVADEILSKLPDNYGIATKADLGTAIAGATSQAITQVQAAPNNYNLYSQVQYQANRITGVAEGKAEVTSNPTAYSLYTESSIMDMNLGGLMLKKDTNGLNLELTVEATEDLKSNNWNIVERISRQVAMDVPKKFLRVRAGAPYVAPTLKKLAHPTLGNILTDGSGRVIYFFAVDTVGGNPLFSGSSWPRVPSPASPKADFGITAIPTSSTYGGTNGTFLTVNGRPTYYYAGDTETGQANGSGSGYVWWTIKTDGTINQ
jgi:predicted lipoprotein with Yx(FWY)xxD motif